MMEGQEDKTKAELGEFRKRRSETVVGSFLLDVDAALLLICNSLNEFDASPILTFYLPTGITKRGYGVLKQRPKESDLS